MRPRRFLFAPLLLCGLFPVLAPPLQGTENVTIQRQMIQRLPVVDAIKLSGRVGEGNDGYLAVRGELTFNEEKAIGEENGDRRKIYAIIAIKTNTYASDVGRARAVQIGERSRRGIWLQDTSGAWHRK